MLHGYPDGPDFITREGEGGHSAWDKPANLSFPLQIHFWSPADHLWTSFLIGME